MEKKHLMPRVARQIPKGISDQNELINKAYFWLKESTDAKSLDRWCLNEGFRPYKFYKLRHTNEYFADVLYMCYSEILERMGEERWQGAGDKDMYMNTMRVWHEGYREQMNEEVATRLRISEQLHQVNLEKSSGIQVQFVEVGRVESTPEVDRALRESNERRNANQIRQVPTTVVPEAIDGCDTE